MGLLDFFGRGPLSQGKIDKIAKLAANPFAQPDVRMREMQRLFNDGSLPALRAVLKRFAANAQGHIADEDEKKWLEDRVVEEGERALEPLAEYIEVEDKLSYALRAFRRIAGPEKTTEHLIGLLKKKGPDDYRSGEAKLQVLLELTELGVGEAELAELAPFLLDHSDDVRWAVMDLFARAAEKATLAPPLRDAAAAKLGVIVTNEEAGPRIQRRAAELLADLEWVVPGDAEKLVSVLDEAFFLDKKRFVRRRSKPAAK